MKPRRLSAAQEAATIFDRAVRERALAVLTLQDDTDWTTFKSRFLERDPRGRFFVLDYLPEDGTPLPAVAPGQFVGVTFRQSSHKLLFATVVEATGHFIDDNQQNIPAVRYRWPESMLELQRRAYYRTPVPDTMSLLVSLWPGGVTARHAGGEEASAVATGTLADLSCGGAMVHLHQAPPAGWKEDDLLGAELQLPDGRTPILVDLRFRGARQDESGVPGVAVQFIGLELTVDGRAVLQRLASCVQRLHRLGLAAGRRNSNLRRI